MKTAASLTIFGVTQAFSTYTQSFMQYLAKQGKSYNSIEEFNMRLENFIASDKFIQEFNSQPNKTVIVGHNFLSDWTQAEKDVITGKAFRKNEETSDSDFE